MNDHLVQQQTNERIGRMMREAAASRLAKLRHLLPGTLAIVVLAAYAGPAMAAIVPDTSIASGPSGPVASKVATFTFASTVAGSTFQCRLDAGAWAACTSPKTYKKLKQGNHTFNVRAKKGTKVDKTPAVRTFTVDTVAPNTTITSGPTGTTLDIRPEFSFGSSQAVSTYECAMDLAAFSTCASPFDANALYIHAPHTFQVRARDAAGNIDATPAARTFTIEPINLGGQPFAEAAADLYFPALVDLDVPAQCGGGIECPGGTPLPASPQVRMQTTDLSVVYAAGTGRFDVTATVSVQTLATTTIAVELPVAGDCTLTLDASQGSLSSWTVRVSLQFTYSPTNGDVRIGAANEYVTGVESQDWRLSGHFTCALVGGFTSGVAGNVLLGTLISYWSSVGAPLCERPAPALVGPCPQ